MNNKITIILLAILTSGCVITNTPEVNITASPTPVPVTSVTPQPGTSPSAEPSPGGNPVQSPSPSASPAANTPHDVTIGLSDVYSKITSGNYDNVHDDIRDESELIIKANPESVIVDLRQEAVDNSLNGIVESEEEDNWDIYDYIFTNLQNEQRNIKVIFKINPVVYPGSSPILSVSNHITFIGQVARRYNNRNIAWIFEEKINDENSLKISREDYLNVLKRTYQQVKSVSSDKKFYMGSIVQSEIFGSQFSYSVDNFLSYLNLGAAEYSDGFIFEIYGLANHAAKDPRHSSKFAGKDYQIIGQYHNLISNVLKQKNITGKELILFSSTYGDETIGNTFQSQQQQARFVFTSFIYGLHLGFTQVYTPKLYDDTVLSTYDFFAKTGLIKEFSTNSQYKTVFWTVSFLSGLLKDSVYSQEITNLPNGIKGYIFDKPDSKIYVLWNDLEPNNAEVRLKLNTSRVTLYTSPVETDDSVDKIEQFLSPDQDYIAAFKSDALRPVILEVMK